MFFGKYHYNLILSTCITHTLLFACFFILCLIYILVKRECKGYIRLIFHTLDLFSPHLEALGDMLVNHSRVKGNKNVSNGLPRYRWFSHESVNATFVCTSLIHILPKISMSTRDENVKQALHVCVVHLLNARVVPICYMFVFFVTCFMLHNFLYCVVFSTKVLLCLKISWN